MSVAEAAWKKTRQEIFQLNHLGSHSFIKLAELARIEIKCLSRFVMVARRFVDLKQLA